MLRGINKCIKNLPVNNTQSYGLLNVGIYTARERALRLEVPFGVRKVLALSWKIGCNSLMIGTETSLETSRTSILL